jgi:hypothetical protein
VEIDTMSGLETVSRMLPNVRPPGGGPASTLVLKLKKASILSKNDGVCVFTKPGWLTLMVTVAMSPPAQPVKPAQTRMNARVTSGNVRTKGRKLMKHPPGWQIVVIGRYIIIYD